MEVTYMLDIIIMENFVFAPLRGVITKPDDVFKTFDTRGWTDTSMAKRAIEKIDGGKVIASNVIEHPDYGVFSPDRLAGGTQMLMMMQQLKDRFVYDFAAMGANCSEFIDEATEGPEHIVGLVTYNIPLPLTRSVICINDNSVLHTLEDYKAALRKFLHTSAPTVDWKPFQQKYGVMDYSRLEIETPEERQSREVAEWE